MKAAELLRGLDKAATAGPWHWVDQGTDEPSAPGDDCASLRTVAETESAFGYRSPKWILDAESMNEDWKADANRALIATTRNLLPLLAGLVEAVGEFAEAVKGLSVVQRDGTVEGPAFNGAAERVTYAEEAMVLAYCALNAAAAKEAADGR